MHLWHVKLHFRPVKYDYNIHEQKRLQIMKGMQKAMGDLPNTSALPPLDIQYKDSLKGEKYTRYTIIFTAAENEKVPALLYIPFQIDTSN